MFDTSDPYFLTRLFGVVVLIALVWEVLWPRRAETPDLRFRWLNNLSLVAVGQVFAAGIRLLAAAALALAVELHIPGLLSDTGLPWGVVFGLTVLAFDGGAYILHVILHKFGWLWRFHAVHHSDTSLDVTSTYRHHPGEIIISSVFSLPLLVLLAPPASAYLGYQALRMSVNVLQHSNIRIPQALERVLSKLVATPDFHRLHHSSDRRHTDSNYGSVLPWFDYLFRTATSRPYAEQASMQLGLEYFRARRDARLDQLLLMPFTWRREAAAPAAGDHGAGPVTATTPPVRG